MPIFNAYVMADDSIVAFNWALKVTDGQFLWAATATGAAAAPIVMDTDSGSDHYQLFIATGEFGWRVIVDLADDEVILRDTLNTDDLWLLRVNDGQFNWTLVEEDDNDIIDDMEGNIFRCLPNRLTNWVKVTNDTCAGIACPINAGSS